MRQIVEYSLGPDSTMQPVKKKSKLKRRLLIAAGAAVGADQFARAQVTRASVGAPLIGEKTFKKAGNAVGSTARKVASGIHAFARKRRISKYERLWRSRGFRKGTQALIGASKLLSNEQPPKKSRKRKLVNALGGAGAYYGSRAFVRHSINSDPNSSEALKAATAKVFGKGLKEDLKTTPQKFAIGTRVAVNTSRKIVKGVKKLGGRFSKLRSLFKRGKAIARISHALSNAFDGEVFDLHCGSGAGGFKKGNTCAKKEHRNGIKRRPLDIARINTNSIGRSDPREISRVGNKPSVRNHGAVTVSDTRRNTIAVVRERRKQKKPGVIKTVAAIAGLAAAGGLALHFRRNGIDPASQFRGVFSKREFDDNLAENMRRAGVGFVPGFSHSSQRQRDVDARRAKAAEAAARKAKANQQLPAFGGPGVKIPRHTPVPTKQIDIPDAPRFGATVSKPLGAEAKRPSGRKRTKGDDSHVFNILRETKRIEEREMNRKEKRRKK